MSLRHILLPASSETPEYLLVGLHGWGANAQDLAGLVPYFDLPGFAFIFPDAPFSHYQVPGGRAWYSLETPNYEGLEESRQLLADWLLSLPEITGVPLEKIVCMGFSQGGAMTIDVGLNFPLAALCSLSGYLHSPPQIKNREKIPPILIMHGSQDPIVPVKAAQEARDILNKLGAKVQYQEFPIGHEITPAEIKYMEKFLRKIVPTANEG
ncbi:MAG: alpha/beta hydrolase [Cyanobacteria bacterium J083]|nr:MAG: alpha/beta hydrolase [Cyanobacteria bacterium J083]